MVYKKTTRALILFLFIYSSISLFSVPGSQGQLTGVKIYQYKGDYDQLFKQWKTLGIDTAFIGLDLARQENFIAKARKNNLKTFIVVPIFFNPEILKTNPDLYAITGEGKPAKKEWVEFVCPTRKNYRVKRIEFIKKLVKDINPDGISIDFIRYFVFWEKVYPATKLNPLHNTCFCSHCLDRFQKETGEKIPSKLKDTRTKAQWILKHHRDRWVAWKCGIITSMVKNITTEVKKVKPGIRFNLHVVPWRRGDFDNGIKRVTGQDIAALSKYVDYVSPMCYAHMVKQPPSWVHDVTKDIASQTALPVLPSIQVGKAYLEKKLTADIFKQSLEQALKTPSKGVVFWNWETLTKSPEKIKTLK